MGGWMDVGREFVAIGVLGVRCVRLDGCVRWWVRCRVMVCGVSRDYVYRNTFDSYVGIIYLILMNASSPP